MYIWTEAKQRNGNTSKTFWWERQISTHRGFNEVIWAGITHDLLQVATGHLLCPKMCFTRLKPTKRSERENIRPVWWRVQNSVFKELILTWNKHYYGKHLWSSSSAFRGALSCEHDTGQLVMQVTASSIRQLPSRFQDLSHLKPERSRWRTRYCEGMRSFHFPWC